MKKPIAIPVQEEDPEEGLEVLEKKTNAEGDEISTREIKKLLQEVVDAEDKQNPLTDEQLVAVLAEHGYPIARRTIAKYREQLDIPVARLRKAL